MDPAFEFHRLTLEGFKKSERIAIAFDNLLERLKEDVPAGREFAIVKTKLEEACFFAKKGMAQANTEE